MTQPVALGADHGGYPLKAELVPWLKFQGYRVEDLGASSLEPTDDYPDFAESAAHAVASAGQSATS